uniref:Transglutaminase-like domain-containing protein n=1 Tax=Cuerna arida TaxID=1464854 RepID=A0A1B6EUM3_9HEMI
MFNTVWSLASEGASMTALTVETVHTYTLDNAKIHHTDRYELVHNDPATPVLRRGQPFFMAVRFKGGRVYRDFTDEIKFVFNYGTKPDPHQGTKGVVSLSKREIYTGDKTRWDVIVKGADGDTLTVEVQSPVNAPVGGWTLEILTSLQSSQPGDTITYRYPETIYILFNPWLRSDTVYMAEENLLDEYVLNDVGKIWVGPMANTRGREWVFGQFDALVLPAAMLVLERTGLSGLALGDPIKLTRAFSKLVNCNDDQGVLLGRWDGEYDDGTSPSAWTGSVPILEEYLTTKLEVKYGQCWVFAGVLTTLCRALGIPSRVVSNLVSAHDANDSLTIDRYYSPDSEEIPYDPRNPEGADSIWNYHVWNDVWMARPDLPSGYGGWQAVDATPQETSDGVYQCGPASVEAVKRGEVGLKYDVGFMVSSVNADLVRWKEDPNALDGFSKIDCNRYHIGRMILTKYPFVFDPNGDTDRENITTVYKPSEGSKDERAAFYLAAQGTHRAKRFLDVPDAASSPVSFELQELDRINIGENFSISINIKNDSEEVRTIQASLSASSVYYNGVKAHLIKKASGVFKMQPKSKEFLKLTVKADEYLEKLVEYCIIKFYTIATVMETRQTWAGEDDFQVIKPSLQILVARELPLGLSARLAFQMKNPLKKKLTNCKFSYDGPGLVKKSHNIPYRDIGPEAEATWEIMFTPMFAGSYKLVATFDSKELTDITGSVNVDVVDG